MNAIAYSILTSDPLHGSIPVVVHSTDPVVCAVKGVDLGQGLLDEHILLVCEDVGQVTVDLNDPK